MTPTTLKNIRRKLGLTQDQLALAIGVDRNTVNRWEMGKHPINPTAEKLIGLLSGKPKRRK